MDNIKILENDLDNIINLYKNNTSLREIQQITGYNRQKISKILSNIGIKTSVGNHYRKYFFDFNFFENIDDQIKSYWLGFLYADGCVLPQNKYGEQTFKLAIGEKDIKTIEQFKTDMKSSYPIRRDCSRHLKEPTHQVQVLLEQRSQKTVNDLKKLGCVENKSLVLTFPTEEQVPKSLIYHFIRGYFDGDGSICKDIHHKNKIYYSINITETESFIKTLSTYFQYGNVIKDKRKTNSWYYCVHKQKEVIDFCNMIYKDAERYLERKYLRYQELLKYNES